jgi:large subunit ribosomal protein L15
MVSRTNKFRGSRTHGRGKKSGRGAGKHGGTGNAGLHKHKAMHMLKYMPDHFGRHGFKRPQKMVSAKITMNVCDIDQFVQSMVKDGSASKKGDVYTVNLTEMGVEKLLGSGKINVAVEITVAEATETAKQKVEMAGGHIILPQ